MKKKILIISVAITLMAFVYVNINAGLNTNGSFNISLSSLKTAIADDEGGGSMACWTGTHYTNSGAGISFQLRCSGCSYGYIDCDKQESCGK
jgi:hypothetical protein